MQMRGKRLSKRASIATLFLGLMLAGSIAFAAWTASGSGSGYAKAMTAVDLSTVNVAATTNASLYPGGTGDVDIKVHNPNPYPVRVTTVALNPAGTITSDKAGCDGTNVSFAGATGLSVDVAANGGETAKTLTGSITMIADAANACQGAVFTIPVLLSGQSNA